MRLWQIVVVDVRMVVYLELGVVILKVFFFFFMQNMSYEISACLVGSEMFI